MKRNVQRVRSLIESIVGIVRGIDRLFNWEYGVPRTVLAMIVSCCRTPMASRLFLLFTQIQKHADRETGR